MSRFETGCLLAAGIAAAAGAVLHVAIVFGGPDWYAFFGAPTGMVEMARGGNLRAPVSALVIAAFLALCAAYAFSGARIICRLPFLRLALTLIGGLLILRGVLFVPLILWRPNALARMCECRSVDTFIILTSVLCLAMGIGYALGAIAVRDASTRGREAPRTR